MRGSGIKASKLIKQLQEAIKLHGDREVWTGGQDYPSGVTAVYFRNKPDDGYYPANVFTV